MAAREALRQREEDLDPIAGKTEERAATHNAKWMRAAGTELTKLVMTMKDLEKGLDEHISLDHPDLYEDFPVQCDVETSPYQMKMINEKMSQYAGGSYPHSLTRILRRDFQRTSRGNFQITAYSYPVGPPQELGGSGAGLVVQRWIW